MNEYCKISLPKHENTVFAGASLGRTLYAFPVTIFLSGELGAGKTTFLQGFARGLGIARNITSPTFALEQRYETRLFGELTHIDLYRLTTPQARELLLSSEESAMIRAIEWPERLELQIETAFPEHIHILLEENNAGRSLTVTFADIPFPSEDQIRQWRMDFLLPAHLIRHCDTVASFAMTLAKKQIKNGSIVRCELLRKAALAHDLLRFVDFRTGMYSEQPITPAQERLWAASRTAYAGLRHEAACAAFLAKEGFRALGEVVAVHGLTLPSSDRSTIEQKLLFYADKRVAGDRIVSLTERFEDFRKRYGEGKDSAHATKWYAEAQALERELFPEGAP